MCLRLLCRFGFGTFLQTMQKTRLLHLLIHDRWSQLLQGRWRLAIVLVELSGSLTGAFPQLQI
jgi:hypothetical protein